MESFLIFNSLINSFDTLVLYGRVLIGGEWAFSKMLPVVLCNSEFAHSMIFNIQLKTDFFQDSALG